MTELNKISISPQKLIKGERRWSLTNTTWTMHGQKQLSCGLRWVGARCLIEIKLPSQSICNLHTIDWNLFHIQTTYSSRHCLKVSFIFLYYSWVLQFKGKLCSMDGHLNFNLRFGISALILCFCDREQGFQYWHHESQPQGLTMKKIKTQEMLTFVFDLCI